MDRWRLPNEETDNVANYIHLLPHNASQSLHYSRKKPTYNFVLSRRGICDDFGTLAVFVLFILQL